jgi:EAL and modified HD-GYP domain-containing signal transduction protein
VTDTANPPESATGLFLARQPIFDATGKLHGYELLHRRDETGGADIAAGDDQMSSEVIVNAFLSIGIARIIGESMAHVNFSRTLLLDGVHRMLAPEQVVVELLPQVEPDAEVIQACVDLVQAGFTLVLDDFRYRPEMEPLLAIASIVKVDVLDKSPGELAAIVTKLQGWPVRLLAMRVETVAMRDTCRELGFNLFQGYFFSRPELVKHRELAASPITIMRLLTMLRDDNSSELDIEKAFQGNMSLTVKLLRAVNSAAMGGRGIESIRQATRLLGRAELNRWLSLMLVTNSKGKNAIDDELMHIVMRRARMCETVAIASGDRRADSHFIVGLFSMLDAVLRAPMADLLHEVDLSREVNEALLERTGPYAPVLRIVEAFERGEWDVVKEQCAALGIESSVVAESYADALGWATARIKASRA